MNMSDTFYRVYLNISVEVFFLYAYLKTRFVDDNKSATKNDHEQLATNFHYIKF